jgi:hypothetical protein
VSASKRVAWLASTLALRAKPALVVAEHVSTVRAVLEVWRHRWFGELIRIQQFGSSDK